VEGRTARNNNLIREIEREREREERESEDSTGNKSIDPGKTLGTSCGGPRKEMY